MSEHEEEDRVDEHVPVPVQMVLPMNGGTLILGITPGTAAMALRLEWETARGFVAYRVVTMLPEDRAELMAFLQAAPGWTACSFCAAPLAEVDFMAESRLGRARICDGCVREVHAQLPSPEGGHDDAG